MDPWVEVPASAGEIIVPVLMDLADYKALAGRSLSIGSHGYAQMWDRPHVRLTGSVANSRSMSSPKLGRLDSTYRSESSRSRRRRVADLFSRGR